MFLFAFVRAGPNQTLGLSILEWHFGSLNPRRSNINDVRPKLNQEYSLGPCSNPCHIREPVVLWSDKPLEALAVACSKGRAVLLLLSSPVRTHCCCRVDD